jgi:hypothetical protein
MLQGETIMSGAAETCSDCKRKLDITVCESGAGFYLGTWCNCGPYSRETGYMGYGPEGKANAERALAYYKKTGILTGMRT